VELAEPPISGLNGRHVAAGAGIRPTGERSLGGGSRVHRILRLINIMRSGETLGIEELTRRMRISRRTVFRDLEMLAQSGIPCSFDPCRRGYRISEWYFLRPTSLSLPEALGLYMAAARIVQSKAFPFAGEAVRAAEKVVQSLPSGVRSMCLRQAEVVSIRWPAGVDATPTRQVFQTLQEAAAERHKVQLTYDSEIDKREIRLTIHPYSLVLLDRIWYLIAYIEQLRQVQTLNLDRIVASDLLESTFPEPSGFSLDMYLGKAWSVTPEGKVWPVRLRFSPAVAGDIEEICWHKTQQTQRLADGSLIFEAEVDGLKEISSWILGYGDQVVVEGPMELRDHIRQITRSVLAKYAE
jgi:predicted DNA-binding transcriptional regulator YafY